MNDFNRVKLKALVCFNCGKEIVQYRVNKRNGYLTLVKTYCKRCQREYGRAGDL
jgi:hypothetical protein